jgi:hypothetical protein
MAKANGCTDLAVELLSNHWYECLDNKEDKKSWLEEFAGGYYDGKVYSPYPNLIADWVIEQIEVCLYVQNDAVLTAIRTSIDRVILHNILKDFYIEFCEDSDNDSSSSDEE